MNTERKDYINQWLLKAENDIITAQRLIEIEPLILDNAGFHCQQAIEKCLKGYLFYQGKNIERTHDLIYLLESCSQFDIIFEI